MTDAPDLEDLQRRLAAAHERADRNAVAADRAAQAIAHVHADVSPVLGGRALRDVIGERIDQLAHGFTREHDLHHTAATIALGGASYANTAIDQLHGIAHPANQPPDTWPFADGWNPRADARANLVKATAMLWAAIDRFDADKEDIGATS